MRVDIYRVCGSDSSILHDEVCRCCAKSFQEKGYDIEFDTYLSKYIYEKDGVSYYSDGSDDDDGEITCSICDNFLLSDNDNILENS